MADQDLREVFNDCINRLTAGQSIGDCLRTYPQYADELEPMLEINGLVERMQASPFEINAAQTRVRARVNAQLRAARPSHHAYGRLTALVASLLVVFAALFIAAERSLPGDPLYNVKRFSENARTTLIGEQFGGRRLDEIQALEAIKRPEPVEFSGQVEQIDGVQWRIAGLDIQVAAGVPGADAASVGATVKVNAYTTNQGDLIASALTLLNPSDMTPILTETITPPPSPTRTPTLTVTPQPTACTPTQPAGWISYVVQFGDTVVELAALTGAPIDQVIAVNCLPETRMIITGETLYLPMKPAPAATLAPTIPTELPTENVTQPTLQPTAAPTVEATDDHHSEEGGDD